MWGGGKPSSPHSPPQKNGVEPLQTPGGHRPRPQVALQDLQTNSKIAALLPYFVYVVSGVSVSDGMGLGGGLRFWGGDTHPALSPTPPPPVPVLSVFYRQVKSVSHDLEQLNRLLHIARSLIQNPFLCLGSYVRSLIASVMYCALEPLAASINPLNDHWTLRDYAAMLLSRIFWWVGAVRNPSRRSPAGRFLGIRRDGVRGGGPAVVPTWRWGQEGPSCRLQDSRRSGERSLPSNPALAPEGVGRSRASSLLSLRGGGGIARSGLEGNGRGGGEGGV